MKRTPARELRLNEKGSVLHFVLVGVLVVGIAAVLAWAFVNNSNTTPDSVVRSDTPTDSTPEPKTSSKLVDGSIDKSFGETLTFKYPETWQYDQELTGTVGEVWGQGITITSPTGKYAVKYNVNAGGGVGGGCLPTETGLIASIKYDTLASFPKTAYVEQTSKKSPEGAGQDGGYVGLAKLDVARAIKVGKTDCQFYFANIIDLSEDGTIHLLDAWMDIENADTADQIMASLNGEEYEQAKAILLSTSR